MPTGYCDTTNEVESDANIVLPEHGDDTPCLCKDSTYRSLDNPGQPLVQSGDVDPLDLCNNTHLHMNDEMDLIPAVSADPSSSRKSLDGHLLEREEDNKGFYQIPEDDYCANTTECQDASGEKMGAIEAFYIQPRDKVRIHEVQRLYRPCHTNQQLGRKRYQHPCQILYVLLTRSLAWMSVV